MKPGTAKALLEVFESDIDPKHATKRDETAAKYPEAAAFCKEALKQIVADHSSDSDFLALIRALEKVRADVLVKTLHDEEAALLVREWACLAALREQTTALN